MLELESQKRNLEYEIETEKLNVPIILTKEQIEFWFYEFAKGDINDPNFCQRLIDTFINKIILFNDKVVIIYNVKDGDKEKLTTDEVMAEFANKTGDNALFGYDRLGGRGGATIELVVSNRCVSFKVFFTKY